MVQLRAIYDEHDLPQDMQIERINQAYTRIIGLTAQQVEGRLARESGEASFETDFLFSGKWLRVYAPNCEP